MKLGLATSLVTVLLMTAGSVLAAESEPYSAEQAPPPPLPPPAQAGPGAEGWPSYAPTTPPPAGAEPSQAPVPSAAPAEPDDPEEPEGQMPGPGEPLGSYQTHWQAVLGARVAFVGNTGFDPFSKNDVLAQFSLGAGRTLFNSGDMSLAATAYWDYGQRSADVRGEDTSLAIHRLTLGPELRFHLLPFLYAFARVSPGAMRSAATLEDSVTGTTLEAKSWTFALDGAVGGAVQVLGKRSAHSRRPRMWLLAEGGYGWATSSDLTLDATEDAAPARVAALDLGSLAVRGPMFRVSAALTF